MQVTRLQPTLSWPQATMQFTRNMGLGMKYAIPNLLDNTLLLKNNSLIVASLILVLSRILIANLSALKAKGTPQGPYRYQESMRTTIREAAGWTLSFAVLRQFQGFTQSLMRKTFGILDIDPSTPTTFSSHFSENVRALIKRQRIAAPADWVDPARERTFNFVDNRASQTAIRMMRKIPGLTQKTPLELMSLFYRITPSVLGAVPTIILSGFLLETLTREKSDEMINTVSRIFNRDKASALPTDTLQKQFGAIPPASAPTLQAPQPPVAPFSMPAANPFNLPGAANFSASPYIMKP